MSIEVVKIRECANAVYIGRGSPLGNPFVIGKDGNRDEVCDKYEAYFEQQLKRSGSSVEKEIRRLKALLEEHGMLKLGCFCAPQRCHGDTIKKHLEA